MDLNKEFLEQEQKKIEDKLSKYYTIKEIYNHNTNFIIILSNSKENLEIKVTKSEIFDFIEDNFRNIISNGLLNTTAIVENNKIKSVF